MDSIKVLAGKKRCYAALDSKHDARPDALSHEEIEAATARARDQEREFQDYLAKGEKYGNEDAQGLVADLGRVCSIRYGGAGLDKEDSSVNLCDHTAPLTPHPALALTLNQP